MERHFTATAYILKDKKFLLHLHPKLKRWLPPGGHIELNETPPEAALREVKEETGLDVEIIRQENLWVESENASSLERPFLCLLENVPSKGDVPAHQHIDQIYLARPIGEVPDRLPNGFRWFSFEDLQEIEEELFLDTKETLRMILSTLQLF